MQKVKKSCRKLAQKLSCMDTPWEVPEYTARLSGTVSGSVRTPTGSSELVTGGTSAFHTPTHYSSAGRTPPHYTGRKVPAVEEDEDDDEDEEASGFRIQHCQRDPYHQEELGFSQL
jgi:hypothetical protein